MGILLEVIDGEGMPGRPGKPRDREEKKDSHGWASCQEGFDGGAPWESPGVPRDGEKMIFPTIAAPQAPESVGDANRSSRAHDRWELMAGEWVPRVQHLVG